jgi:hypothetical protein
MKPVYSNITPARTVHIGGIFNLQVVPREWLQSAPVIDFNTNTVLTPVVLQEDREWLTLQLVEDSLSYGEKPKSNANGSYYEVSTGGLLNYHDAELLQLMETLRYHEFIVVTKDKRKQYRIVGGIDNGMILQFTHDEDEQNGGTSRSGFSFTMDLEKSPPYYVVSSGSSS